MVIAARGLRKFMREELNMKKKKRYPLTVFLGVGEMRANRGWSPRYCGPGHCISIFISLFKISFIWLH